MRHLSLPAGAATLLRCTAENTSTRLCHSVSSRASR
jgi:hypothetical protein